MQYRLGAGQTRKEKLKAACGKITQLGLLLKTTLQAPCCFCSDFTRSALFYIDKTLNFHFFAVQ